MTQKAERDLISSNQDLNGLLTVVLQSKWRLVSDRLQKIVHLRACIMTSEKSRSFKRTGMLIFFI